MALDYLQFSQMNLSSTNVQSCSFGWWLMAGADLF
jgi:hypothetical protein